MFDIDVDYEDLIRFKKILDQNANHFDEIRTGIGQTINQITSSDWQDPQSEQFSEVFFSQSDPDITALVETMREFSAYLHGKIETLQAYHNTKINFNS